MMVRSVWPFLPQGDDFCQSWTGDLSNLLVVEQARFYEVTGSLEFTFVQPSLLADLFAFLEAFPSDFTPRKRDSLALTLGGSKRFPKAKALLAFGRTHCGFSEALARRLLDEVAEGMLSVTQSLQVHMRERPEFAEIGARMLRAWEAGLNCSLRFDGRPPVSVMAMKGALPICS